MLRFAFLVLLCLSCLSCSSAPPSSRGGGAIVWGEIDWGTPTAGGAGAGGALEAQAGAAPGGRTLAAAAGAGGALEAQAGAAPGGSGGRVLAAVAGAGGGLEGQAGAAPAASGGSLTLGELAAARVPAGFAVVTERRQAFSSPQEWLTLLFLVEPARCYQIAAAVESGEVELAFYADGVELVSAMGTSLPGCYAWTAESRLIEARARASEPALVAFVVAVR